MNRQMNGADYAALHIILEKETKAVSKEPDLVTMIRKTPTSIS